MKRLRVSVKEILYFSCSQPPNEDLTTKPICVCIYNRLVHHSHESDSHFLECRSLWVSEIRRSVTKKSTCVSNLGKYFCYDICAITYSRKHDSIRKKQIKKMISATTFPCYANLSLCHIFRKCLIWIIRAQLHYIENVLGLCYRPSRCPWPLACQARRHLTPEGAGVPVGMPIANFWRLH